MLRSYARALAFLLVLLTAGSALAVSKPAGTVVKSSSTKQVIHVANVAGKSVNAKFSCYRGNGGQVQKVSRKLYFVNFSTLLKNSQKALKAARTAKAKKKARSDIALYKVLRTDSPSVCSVAQQASHSFARYNGPFGLKQAQRLVEVFALGGRPGLADAYAAMGMDAAINDLTTLKDDSAVESFRARLTCGPNPRDNEDPDQCYEDGDINDFYMDGAIAGINWRMIYSNNPAFMKLFQFAMDERAPVNPRVLDGESQWMFLEYLAKVDRFMVSGDYKAFIAELINDPVEHGMWLSGASNHQGVLKTGNEDFAREALELLTTGLYKPDGSPVYTDLDVYENSRVMSGLSISRVTDARGNGVKAVGFFPAFHAPGAKTLFAGTPQQMVIDTAEDFAREIFIKQRDQVAFELAWRLWRRFINDHGTTSDFLNLAQVIVDNDFKLWPVIRRMMASQAFYAPESAETLLKDPHTYYVSMARMTGMPIDNYNWMMGILDDIGMRLGRPPTVFGFMYQNQQLASDIYQLGRFNGLVYHLLWQNLDDVEEHYGWTPHNGFVAGIPLTGNPARDLVNEMLKRLNMTDALNEDQKAAFDHMLNYYLSDCNSQSNPECFMYNGRRMRWYRDAPDLGNSTDDFYRLRLAYILAASNPAFAAM